MGNTQARSKQEEETTEEAWWLLEGSHGMARDAEAAMVLLEDKVKDGNTEAMWMLGVCSEFGIGTEQDVERAEKLYKRGAKRNVTAKILANCRMKNKNGQSLTQLNLYSEQENKQTSKQPKIFVNQMRWCTEKMCGIEGAKALSLLLVYNPLTTVNLSCNVNIFLLYIGENKVKMIVVFLESSRQQDPS